MDADKALAGVSGIVLDVATLIAPSAFAEGATGAGGEALPRDPAVTTYSKARAVELAMTILRRAAELPAAELRRQLVDAELSQWTGLGVPETILAAMRRQVEAKYAETSPQPDQQRG